MPTIDIRDCTYRWPVKSLNHTFHKDFRLKKSLFVIRLGLGESLSCFPFFLPIYSVCFNIQLIIQNNLAAIRRNKTSLSRELLVDFLGFLTNKKYVKNMVYINEEKNSPKQYWTSVKLT